MKTILSVIVLIIVIIQFIQPKKNNTADMSNSIKKVLPISDTLNNIFQKACYDCHSNHTNYPWYTWIQPLSWWINHHIEEGKREINFDEFAKYRIGRQYKKIQEINEQVKENEMPLESYTKIHKNAILTEEEKLIIANWCDKMVQYYTTIYPPDSLKRKKSSGQPTGK